MPQLQYLRRLEDALQDLIRRWPDERGYDTAIGRARALLLEGALGFPREPLALPDAARAVSGPPPELIPEPGSREQRDLDAPKRRLH
jgi:hypothetical protein